MGKKTLSTALGFEPRSFDCRWTAINIKKILEKLKKVFSSRIYFQVPKVSEGMTALALITAVVNELKIKKKRKLVF